MSWWSRGFGARPVVPRAARAAAIFAAVFVLLGIGVSLGDLFFDVPVLEAFSDVPATAIWPILHGLNVVGYPAVWDTAVIVVEIAAALILRSRAPLLGPAGLLAAEAITVGAKLIVGRARPNGVVVQDLVTPASFPSGHTVRVVVTAWLIVLVAWPWLRSRGLAIPAVIAAIGISVLIGAARVAAGEHFPSDVLGAYLLSGAFISLVAAYVRVASSPGSSS